MVTPLREQLRSLQGSTVRQYRSLKSPNIDLNAGGSFQELCEWQTQLHQGLHDEVSVSLPGKASMHRWSELPEIISDSFNKPVSADRVELGLASGFPLSAISVTLKTSSVGKIRASWFSRRPSLALHSAISLDESFCLGVNGQVRNYIVHVRSNDAQL